MITEDIDIPPCIFCKLYHIGLRKFFFYWAAMTALLLWNNWAEIQGEFSNPPTF
jgi:hypothetical protein